jgi:tetratricopeptide (TPR) repeat protein
MVHVLTGLCADRMTVFVWDNADDMDRDTLEILQRLRDAIGNLPFVGILEYRTLKENDWVEDAVVTRLRIEPFLENESNRFALSCIGAEHAPNGLLAKLYQATEGNPLVLESFIKALNTKKRFTIAAGKATLEDTAILDDKVSLNDLLRQQIETLPPDEKQILEAAAVIGHRFNTKVLARMVDAEFLTLKSAVIRLKKNHFLFRVSVSEFAFATKALWEVVREGITETDRRQYHLKLSEAFLKLFETRVEYIAARLAMHYEVGGDPVRAIEHYTRAGKKAAEGHAHRAAFHFYVRAQELLRALPGTDADSLVAVCQPIGELAIKSNAYALGLKKIQLAEWVSEEVTDKPILVRVLLLTSELHAHCEHNTEVDWYLDWAMDLSRELSDDDLSFEVCESAGHVYYLLGDMKKAAPMFRKAIEIASDRLDRDRRISCMAKLSKVEASAGELAQAMQTLASAEKLIEESTDLLTRCEIEESRGRAFFMAGNTEKAISSQLKLLEIAKEYGLKEYIANTAYLTGALYLDIGDNAKAFAYLNMSKDLATSIGLKNLVNIDNLLLSYIDVIELGGGDQIEDLEKSLLDALERDAVWEQLHLLYYLSKIYMDKGMKKLAREHLIQLIKLGGTLHNRLYYNKAEKLLKEIDALESIPPR